MYKTFFLVERTSLEREFIVYSMSAESIAVLVALSTVIITLAACCLKFKRKADRLYKLQSRRTQHDQVPLEHENVQSNIEGAYDLIDEETMIVAETLSRAEPSEGMNQRGGRQSATVNQERSSSSNSEGDISNSSSEGYLNPYQPVIEVDVHDYETLADENTMSKEISSGN